MADEFVRAGTLSDYKKRIKRIAAAEAATLRKREWLPHMGKYAAREVGMEQRRCRKYSLTMDEVTEMLREQGGVCACCRQPPPPATKLFIDHEHATGIVRGLLCPRCNTGVGYNEDPLTETWREYIEAHREPV